VPGRKPAVTLIVGAGLAGLAAACTLQDAGEAFLLCEAGDAVGGRVRTDEVDGFLLDRGFQVFLTAYPEAQRLLDYPALRLKSFYAGAYLAWQGKLRLMADPWRHPVDALRSLTAGPATWGDRLRIGRLRLQGSAAGIVRVARDWRAPRGTGQPSPSTQDRLQAEGFSGPFRKAFLEPFFRGIFLDPALRTSADLFRFVFGMMAQGETTVPEDGMEAIPRQLAQRIPAAALRLNHRCVALEMDAAGGGRARFETGQVSGETVSLLWDRMILAVEEPAACELLGWPAPRAARQTTSIYFAAQQNPLKRQALVLFGENGPVNHLAVLSAVAPSYAPPGQHLLVANLVGQAVTDAEAVLPAIRNQLLPWFGEQVNRWRYLRAVSVPFAQPNQDADLGGRNPQRGPLTPGVVLAGDFTTNASIDGALYSGVRAAQSLLGLSPGGEMRPQGEPGR
jgi:phytoene dehydrogenase-like protein